MEILYICLIGYFIGAIPFAYVIGKVFVQVSGDILTTTVDQLLR